MTKRERLIYQNEARIEYAKICLKNHPETKAWYLEEDRDVSLREYIDICKKRIQTINRLTDEELDITVN